MFSQLTNSLYQCRQQGEMPMIREKMNLFQEPTALPLKLHFHVVTSYYNVRCWIWKWKHFFSLLFVSTPESHEERRKKQVMQLDYKSCDTLHGLEGWRKGKEREDAGGIGNWTAQAYKGKSRAFVVVQPLSSAMLSATALKSSQQWVLEMRKPESG